MDETSLSRRAWIATLTRAAAGGSALALLGALRPPALRAGEAPRRIVVYKDPDCGCCRDWVTYLGRNGFAPQAHDRTDMDALKDSLGVPAALRSCHTAVIGRYAVEGHVTAADIVKLVTKAPKGIAGIAAPGMPAGSPGMEMPGRHDTYDVIAWTAGGRTSVFAKHP